MLGYIRMSNVEFKNKLQTILSYFNSAAKKLDNVILQKTA